MTEEERDQQKPELHSDEEWKKNIKAEDAAIDEKLRSEQPDLTPKPSVEADSTDNSTDDSKADSTAEKSKTSQRLPTAQFATIVSMFSTQAMVAMGLIPNPVDDKSEIELELAGHFIDLLGILEEKCKGNLDAADETLLSQTLHQLRMIFVELKKNENSKAGDTP